MPSWHNFLDDCGPYIQSILENAGVAQCSIHLERYGKLEQERTFYNGEQQANFSRTESGETFLYGIGSQTKLLVVLVLGVIIDKLSYSREEKHREYRILREIWEDPWEVPFTEAFNHFSDIKIAALPGNPTLRHVALHYNSLPPMNHAILALDGTPFMSKESFLRVGPHLAERAYKRTGNYFEYSNGNYMLIGCFIEAVAKQSLAVVMREHLLKPLGMNHTYMNAPSSPDIRIAHPFVVSADGTRHPVERSPFPEDSLVNSAMGAHSSVTDFATLLRRLLAAIEDDESLLMKDVVLGLLKPEGILNDETTDRMSLFGICTTLETSTPGCRSYNRLISPENICSTYCLGRQGGEKEVMAYYIAGAIKGYTCSSYLIPKHQAFIVVFTNSTGLTDASDHISRLILQRSFDLSLNSRDLASLSLKKGPKGSGIRPSDLKNGIVDIVDMSSRAAAEGKSLLEKLAREDAEKSISSPSPVILDGVYRCDAIEQIIIIKGEKATIVGTVDNHLHRQPKSTLFIRTGELEIRLQPNSIVDFTIDRYDSYGWKELCFNLTVGKDANNNNRVVCLSRQSALFLDEFKFTEAASLVS